MIIIVAFWQVFGEQRDGITHVALFTGRFERGVDIEGGEGVCETRGGRTVFALPPTMV